MNKLVNELLNDLLDKYEGSVLSKGGSDKNIKIKFTTKNSILKKYVDLESYKYVDDIDKAVAIVEQLGFINVERKHDGTFVSLELNLNKVKDVYAYLDRKSRDQVNGEIIELLTSYEWSGIYQSFKEGIIDSINEKYTFPKKYFDSYDQLKDICRSLDAISLLVDDIKERDFSIKTFGDSKKFSSIKSKISSILRDYSKDEYEDDDDVLSDFHIVKNSTYVLVKGSLVFKLRDQIIDLSKLGFECSLSDEMIKELELVDCSFSKVITVENLTTFYGFDEVDALIVYLAGFHNHTKQRLLTKLYSAKPKAEYFHFGDIDAGGILIYQNLCVKTGIPFKPYYMFYANAADKKKYLKPLTEHDRARLQLMLKNMSMIQFADTIKWMLDNNAKLEQESFDLKF